MSSQFDDLLGDFGGGDSSATLKTNGNQGAEDSGLLLDFSVGAEVSCG